jgi:hypothetical protein
MKAIIFSFLVLSQMSYAIERAGGSNTQTLKCKTSTIETIGSDVTLKLTFISGVAPQYRVKSIDLTQKALIKLATAKTTKLKQDSQTAYNATFTAKDIKVELDKANNTAVLNLGAIEYNCK